MKGDKPYISVIIPTYNRKEFLLDAFNSVLNQTLDRSKYEIIVTKNFVDEKIDNYIKKNGGKLVFFEKKELGERIVDSLRYVKGDVICFLDDDDLFTKDKLEYVYNIFKNNNNVVYINNSRRYIDEKGRYLSKSFSKFEKREKDIIIREEDKKPTNLLRIQRYSNPWFNNSSIAIKASILKRFKKNLKDVKICTDLFYYFVSLISGDLIISAKELTLNRVHESASNSIKEYASYKRNRQSSEDWKYITNVALKQSSIKANKELKKYFYIFSKDVEITHLFYAGNYRRRVLLDYLEILPYTIRAFPKIAILRGLQVAFYIIAPEKFRRFNYERVKKYMESITPKNS